MHVINDGEAQYRLRNIEMSGKAFTCKPRDYLSWVFDSQTIPILCVFRTDLILFSEIIH